MRLAQQHRQRRSAQKIGFVVALLSVTGLTEVTVPGSAGCEEKVIHPVLYTAPFLVIMFRSLEVASTLAIKRMAAFLVSNPLSDEPADSEEFRAADRIARAELKWERFLGMHREPTWFNWFPHTIFTLFIPLLCYGAYVMLDRGSLGACWQFLAEGWLISMLGLGLLLELAVRQKVRDLEAHRHTGDSG